VALAKGAGRAVRVWDEALDDVDLLGVVPELIEQFE